MTDHERFLATFSHLHASAHDTKEVTAMLENHRQKRRARLSRRAFTLALAAILLLGLGVTAYAVGAGFLQRQQAKIRQEYQAEENHLQSYVAYETPSAPQEGVSLLSAYASEGGLTVYFTVSPVAPEDVRDPFMQELEDDGRFHYLMYGVTVGDTDLFAHFYTSDEWAYLPEERFTWTDASGLELSGTTDAGRQRRYFTQCYDAETRTLTLYTGILRSLLPPGDTVELHIASYDCRVYPDAYELASSGYESTLHQDFGVITVEIPPADTRHVLFPAPIRFDNPAYSGSAELLGADISATGLTWLVRVDDPEAHYESEGSPGMDAYLRQVSWGNRISEILADAVLRFIDGTELPCAGFDAYRADEALVLYLSGGWSSAGTIDIQKLESLSVAGQRFALPPVEDFVN